MKKGEELSHSSPLLPLQSQVNLFPGILTYLAKTVVAWFQLNHLKIVLHCRDIPWSQFSHLGTEGHEASVVLLVSEDAALEGFSCFFVCKLTDLHLSVLFCKGNERPAVDDSLVVVTGILCHSSKSLSGLWACQSRRPNSHLVNTANFGEDGFSSVRAGGDIPNPRLGGGGV